MGHVQYRLRLPENLQVVGVLLLVPGGEVGRVGRDGDHPLMVSRIRSPRHHRLLVASGAALLQPPSFTADRLCERSRGRTEGRRRSRWRARSRLLGGDASRNRSARRPAHCARSLEKSSGNLGLRRAPLTTTTATAAGRGRGRARRPPRLGRGRGRRVRGCDR